MGRSFCIVSGKGGVGKTTVTASLAAAFSRLGRRVAVVETDTGLRCLDIHLGLQDRVVYDLGDVLFGRCSAQKAFTLHPELRRLSLLAAPVEPIDLPYDKLSALIRQLTREFDVVLVDAPAGFGDLFDTVVNCCDVPIVVTTLSGADQRGTQRLASLLPEKKRAAARLIVNRINPRWIARGDASDIDTIMDTVHLRLAGLLPEQPQLDTWLNAGGHVLRKKSRLVRAALSTAQRLEGGSVPLYRFW